MQSTKEGGTKVISIEQLARVGISSEGYSQLSDEEKKVVDEVLSNISSSESLESLEQLYYSDYDEVPVDFITFITDDRYLGKSTRNGQFLYPFWKKEIPKIFASNMTEVALSGSIGVGKTTVADLMMIYHLYKMMCMKDPQSFFNLAPGTQIVYAFLNNTLSSSRGVAYSAFQAFIQESPWFLEHGRVVGREYPEYVPEKGFKFIVGSRPQHTLGQAVICLTGDTEIFTSTGIEKIEDLVGKTIRVISYDENEGKVVSIECTVQVTGEVNELIEIELDDGTKVKCTPEHRLMLSDGTYKMAKDLTESDELKEVV